MALGTQEMAGRGGHVVQFYEHDSELVEAVGPYLTAAARGGEAALVIATEPHRRAFEGELEAEGIDLVQARASGRFFSLDAATVMTAFMTDGQVDRDAFHEMIGGLVRKAASSARAVRAYGEMVALLWDAGNVLAAIELETLWNDLARELPFSLLCSYPAASVSGSEHAQALQHVCHLHSSVLGRSAYGARGLEDRPSGSELKAEFTAEPDAPGHARQLLLAAMRQWGHEGPVVDSSALVLSELANNAVLHAASPFSIEIRMDDSSLRIAVQDKAPLAMVGERGMVPRPMHGLSMIDALSTRWGVEGTRDGKVVWAELSAI